MKHIFNPAQMREMEKLAAQSGGLGPMELMERAAEAFVEALQGIVPTDADTPIVVFAGFGNNGGDGLAIARRLLEAGRAVSVFLFNTGKGLSACCAEEKRRLLEAASGRLSFSEVLSQFTPPHLDSRTVVIDALFGMGLSRPLSGGFSAVAKYVNASAATVVSVDVPSGLMAEDNGANVSASIVRADHTITFHAPKLAFLFADNAPYVGRWHAVSIGLPDGGDDAATDGLAEALSGCQFRCTELSDVAGMVRPRPQFAHKGTMGHGLLVAGRTGMAGAAILAARGCLRSGVGKVSVLSTEENRVILQVAVPEALLAYAPELNFAALESVYDALAVGPGLGTDAEAVQLMEAMLPNLSLPLVLDADALNILAQRPDLFGAVPRNSILTPHKGELARLIGPTRDAYEELRRTQEFAGQRHVYVLIKGAYSAVVTPGGEVYFNPTGNAGMATAGAGDVLTGVLLALLAQGYEPEEALRLGVFAHGLAGDAAARDVTETSLVASDIVFHLPAAFRRLGRRETGGGQASAL